MANINATQEVTIWGDGGSKYATIDELSTSAVGLSVNTLGYYTTTDPTLSDGQVFPLRVSASGTLLVDATLTATEVNLRDLEESRDNVRIWSASGTPAINVYLENEIRATQLDIRRIDESYDDIRSYSASGTPDFNVYLENEIRATDLDIRNLDEAQDSIRSLSASGSPAFEVYSVEPQYSIATDPDGNTVNINGDGSLQVTFATGGSSITRMLELRYATPDIGPFEINMWREVVQYAVPSGYRLEIIDFTCYAGNSTSQARATTEIFLGSFDVAADTYTDEMAYTSPYFGAALEMEVVGEIVDDTEFTITYTDQLGATGHVVVFEIPDGAVVGERYQIPLTPPDYGLLDITNITQTGGTDGEVHLHGIVTIFVEVMDISDQTYHQITARESIIIGPEEIVSLSFASTQTAETERYLHILGQLRSIVED